MKILFWPALAILSVILFVSCQRELDFQEIPDNPANPTTNDSILLSSIINLDTNQVAPNDTLNLDIYLYNTRKLVYQTDSYHVTGTGRKLDVRILYYYAGTDTLPNRMTYIYFWAGSPQPDTADHFLTYNAQGIIIYDSTISTAGPAPYFTGISHFDLSGSANMRHNYNYYSMPPGSSGNYYTDYRFGFQGTKMTSQVSKQSVSVSATTDDSIIVTYDNHVNPLYKATNEHYWLLSYNDGTNWFQPNNFTSFYCKSVTPGTPLVEEYRINFTYRYNNNGYPESAVITDLLGTYDWGNKVLYKYTN